LYEDFLLPALFPDCAGCTDAVSELVISEL
jgi:hypothetical protein